MKLSIGPLGALTVIIGLTGCSSSDSMEQRPTSMASAVSMSQDPERPGAWIYRTPSANLRRYTRFIVEPVEVYRGSEASFGSMTNSQITEIAQYLTSEARRELGSGYTVTSQPGPNTARIAMKLVGIERTVPGAATVSRVVPFGAVANAVKGASGGSGSFTGAIILAAEIYDAQTSELLFAAVRRYNPPVFDLEATLSTMDTARSAARQAAEDLRAGVDRIQGRATR
jgi:hypothetical protein